MRGAEEQRKPLEFQLCKLELKLVFMLWSTWFLPVVVAVSFEHKNEAKYDLNLIFVQIYPSRPVKKSQIRCAAATLGFLHIFVTSGALSSAL